jgi:hypothetical protein
VGEGVIVGNRVTQIGGNVSIMGRTAPYYYAHPQSWRLMRMGRYVRCELIGRVGNTGTPATIPHLHSDLPRHQRLHCSPGLMDPHAVLQREASVGDTRQ